MTFFNKKTEVMNIELTPYGRYLYSIGKLKPKYYEFVDDDIIYRLSGSSEAQEDSHQRIMNETPKLKPPIAFQEEFHYEESIEIKNKRHLLHFMDQKQNGLFAMGRSSYSSDKYPNFQVTMFRGHITGSQMVHQVSSSYPPEAAGAFSGSVFIPQINVDFRANATKKNILDHAVDPDKLTSEIYSDGSFVEITIEDPIIHVKEFNSFYEKENFTLEAFEVMSSNGEMKKLELSNSQILMINDLLPQVSLSIPQTDVEEDASEGTNNLGYYLDIVNDENIPAEVLCEVVDSLEINSHFLDEELICPDQRTERFNIYSTKVGPEDLEDCD